MCMSSPSIPAPPPVPAEPAPPPKKTDEAVKRARDDERKRAQLATGLAGTNLTGGSGVTDPALTAGKKVLGA